MIDGSKTNDMNKTTVDHNLLLRTDNLGRTNRKKVRKNLFLVYMYKTMTNLGFN